MREIQRIAGYATVAITNLMKLAGLASAFNQLLITEHPTSLALLVSAGMMFGGQRLEDTVLAALDRVFADDPPQSRVRERE